MIYSLGYKKDSPEKRTQKNALHHLAAIGALATSPPPSASLKTFAYRPILDQNNCGSCTGHGTAQMIYIAAASESIDLGFMPSPGSIYKNTLALERSAATPAGKTLPTLQDTGAMPSDVMAAIAKYGIRPMVAPSPQGFNSDVDPSNVQDETDLIALEKEAKVLVVGDYRIQEGAGSTIATMKQVLAFGGSQGKGVPIGIGALVDTPFMQYSAGDRPLDTPANANDPNAGGHWVCVVGYRTLPNGQTAFEIVNSWSVDYGNSGFVEVTDRWVLGSVSDIYAGTISLKAAS